MRRSGASLLLAEKTRLGTLIDRRYYRLAKEAGYRARAAFKLVQIDASLDLLAGRVRVADLCAAPGGWTQVLAERLPSGSAVVAVDLKRMAPIDGVVAVLGDITAAATARETVAALGGSADLVLCDGAPDVIGLGDVDDFLQHRLVRAALDMALGILTPGGAFLSKVYRGRGLSALVAAAAAEFESVEIAKPRCSRHASAEAFLVCRGFGGGGGGAKAAVPFLGCGGPDAYDADASLPLDLGGTGAAYEYRPPVQGPIDPPHLAAPPPAVCVGIFPRRYADDAQTTRPVATTRPRAFGRTAASSSRPPAATDAASLAAWCPPGP